MFAFLNIKQEHFIYLSNTTAMEKYYKNLILCGDIDFYCIGCQELFQVIPEVEKHIRWDQHRRFIKNQAYLERYKHDHIYKIYNNYYCEFCNILFGDKNDIGKHIGTKTHKDFRSNKKPEPRNFIGFYDAGYVIINKVILNMTQWNSIIDQKCHVCDSEVSDTAASQHMALERHVVNIIQSKTVYEEEQERYYRLVCNNQYHCFTCKKVFSAQDFDNHWSTCENIDSIELKRLKDSKVIGMTDLAKMQELQRKLIGTVQEFYWVDEKNNLATCKYCKTVVNIQFKAMINHMKNKHDKTHLSSTEESSSDEEVLYSEIIDYGKRRSELAQFGRANLIKLNHNGSKGWCSVCDCYMSAHKRVFKHHIRGYIHKGFLEIQGLTPLLHDPEPRDFKTLSVFDYSIEYVPSEKAFYIDSKYVVDVFSFFLLFEIKGNPHFKKTKCFACNELIVQGQERKHCETAEHKEKFLEAKLMEPGQEEDSPNFGEYIREIKPNLYHCGLCNRTLPFRAALEFHKTSPGHQIVKSKRIIDRKTPAIIFNTKHDDVYIKLLTICVKDQTNKDQASKSQPNKSQAK
ncbi:hypothetical protein HF086_010601 [Spodoptera exigua]|uniref:C2H2-type domain-containing protein n=1 Tax=Spodoptera exigua TaxID=7107 RepID=A0A922MV06_SPOEX|nr:hypothetical protein HF086_010601 [Spodoptera exigua]